MKPMERDARKRNIRLFAEEVDNAAACLAASRDEICEQTGLNAERWKALAAIDRSSYMLSISALARRLRHSRQSTHALVLGLERDGLIRFLPNRDDRRLLQMEITREGKGVLSAADGRLNMWLVMMASDLADHELRQLVSTLRAVRGRIARARDYV